MGVVISSLRTQRVLQSVSWVTNYIVDPFPASSERSIHAASTWPSVTPPVILGSAMFRVVQAAIVTIALVISMRPASSQQEPASQLRVYLDCPACDFDFMRTEVAYVDWMRDRADADLHILARSQVTGSGGRLHTLDFIGLRRHAGKGDTLTYSGGRDDTPDITRRGLARTVKIGLMRYIADTPIAEQIRIEIPQASADARTAVIGTAQRDPWNAWVFSVGGSGIANGESSRNQTSISANLGANRTTARWKTNYSLRGSYGRQSFTYDIAGGARDTTVVSITKSYSLSTLMVRSVNGHASVGMRANAGTSTFGNTELFMNLEPAFELNFFPYAESTRRQLVLRYGVGVLSQSYREETVFYRTEETRAVHSISGSLSTRQPWGNLSFGIDGQQFLHDRSLYNTVFSGGTSVNIARGLSLSFSGNYALVRDQISLPRRNLTPEEVLLRQRQVATSYRYFTSMGFSYRFGSAVQNIVNPRFGSSGGGTVIIM